MRLGDPKQTLGGIGPGDLARKVRHVFDHLALGIGSTRLPCLPQALPALIQSLLIDDLPPAPSLDDSLQADEPLGDPPSKPASAEPLRWHVANDIDSCEHSPQLVRHATSLTASAAWSVYPNGAQSLSGSEALVLRRPLERPLVYQPPPREFASTPQPQEMPFTWRHSSSNCVLPILSYVSGILALALFCSPRGSLRRRSLPSSLLTSEWMATSDQPMCGLSLPMAPLRLRRSLHAMCKPCVPTYKQRHCRMLRPTVDYIYLLLHRLSPRCFTPSCTVRTFLSLYFSLVVTDGVYRRPRCMWQKKEVERKAGDRKVAARRGGR